MSCCRREGGFLNFSGGVLFYLEVDDIPAALKTIEDCKGAVIQKKMNLGEHGFIATFKDPNSNRIAP